MENRASRRAEARLAARELVEVLEENAPIDKCLMKAQRLARMLTLPPETSPCRMLVNSSWTHSGKGKDHGQETARR